MKKIVIAGILFLVLVTASFTCKKGLGGLDLRMIVENNFNKEIYYVWSAKYPDTLIPGYPPQPDPTKDPAHKKISPGSDIPIYLRDSWEHVVSTIPEEKLTFFFFDAELLETTNWDTVRAHNMYLERKTLTLDSIKKCIGWFRILYDFKLEGFTVYDNPVKHLIIKISKSVAQPISNL